MYNNCLCCGKKIPSGLFQLSSCMECIKEGCSGVALYTLDGSPRWCNVKNVASVLTQRELQEKDFGSCSSCGEPVEFGKQNEHVCPHIHIWDDHITDDGKIWPYCQICGAKR